MAAEAGKGGMFLVTGGAGFIGSNLVRELVRRGYRVRVLDDFSTGRRESLAGVEGDIEIVEGSITSPPDCARAATGCESVVHLAAQVSVPRSFDDSRRNNLVNVDGTLNVLEAARHAGVQSLVFASSCAVYGNAKDLPITESVPPRPLSPYAVTKLAGEGYCTMHAELGLLSTCTFRFFNVFGPGQDPSSPYSSVIPLFVDRVSSGRRPTIFGDGWQARDFIFVGDVVAALIHAALHPRHFEGGIFNLCSGEATSLNELLATINSLVGTDLAPLYAPPRAGDIRLSQGSYDAFRAAALRTGFDFVPTPLAEGLRKTIGALRAVPAEAPASGVFLA